MAKAKTSKTSKNETASKPTATVTKVTSTKSKLSEELVLGSLFAELVGTFILTAAVINTGGNAIIAAVAVLILVMVLSRLSGGHINPAVTISLWATRQISAIKAGGYLVAQLLGGMLALVVITQFVNGAAADPATGQLPQVFEATRVPGEWRLFFAEGLGGLLLGLGVGAVFIGRGKQSSSGLENGFTIGGSLLLGLVAATLGSAAILNPAVALGLSAYQMGDWWTILAYAAGPIIGVTAGAWLYKLFLWDIDNNKKSA